MEQPRNWLYDGSRQLPPAVAAATWAAVLSGFSALVHAPLACWRGWWPERRWGFSTQALAGRLADRGKGLAVNVLLAAAAWTRVRARARPARRWPLPAAAAAAIGAWRTRRREH